MKIFLIDDLKIINLVNKKYLSQIGKNLEIMDFEDPQMAMNALLKEMPSLIFLDLNMPEINGWDILNHLEKHRLLIPVIILTSSDSPVYRQRAGTYSNIFSFQLKPISKTGIWELIQEVMETPQKKAS
ncbi:MAG: response regulator [Cyclobacteriaceae bacterium]